MIEHVRDAQPLYNRRFFLICAMHLTFMSGYTMLIHLAKYVTAQGGDVGSVAIVFGLGTTGSLISRPFLGRAIDWAGCRAVLLVTTFGAAAVVACFPLMHSTGSIAALRIALQLSQAAFLSSIAVAAAEIAPPGKSAECLATLGVAGIAGMMIGPSAGDWIFDPQVIHDRHTAFHVLFILSTAMMLIGGAIAASMHWPHNRHPSVPDRPSYLRLIREHWPGAILMMGICLALVQTVPILFIERFAVAHHLPGIGPFFAAYSCTAIVLRIVCRTLPARIGRRWTLLGGMACYVIGLIVLRHVERTRGLIFPAMLMGTGHCFTYPFLVDLAAERMPQAHRGVAVSFILATTDFGFLLAFFLQGWLVQQYGFEVSLPATACTALTITLAYAWTQRTKLLGQLEKRIHEPAP